MSETKQEGRQSIFREKSLEALDSPEALNDYLRVTSPRVWLVLAAVIALLVGAILWGILGRIDTSRQVAVVTGAITIDGEGTTEEGTFCFVPLDAVSEKPLEMLAQIQERNAVTVDGKTYAYRIPEDGDIMGGFLSEFVSGQALSKACMIGGLGAEDMVFVLPVDAAFENGVRTGSVIVETLHPISLLLN